MKIELQNRLFDKYPEIFVQKDLPMTQTAMCWGIDTGDGWYDLIDNLCGYITSHCKCNNVVIPEASQVKEKYGTLSFYYSGGDDYVDGAVSFAEHISATICESCGTSESVVQTEGWIVTLCPKHLKEYNRDRFPSPIRYFFLKTKWKIDKLLGRARLWAKQKYK